jgi:hypothetical protein
MAIIDIHHTTGLKTEEKRRNRRKQIKKYTHIL